MVRYIHPMTDWAKTQLYKMDVGKKTNKKKQMKTILHFPPNNILKPQVFVV